MGLSHSRARAHTHKHARTNPLRTCCGATACIWQVYDVYACMQECFAALDGPALECVLHENLHQLKQHWGEVLKVRYVV